MACLPMNETIVDSSMWWYVENGDSKTQGGEKHLDSQGEKGSTSEIMYLKVAGWKIKDRQKQNMN